MYKYVQLRVSVCVCVCPELGCTKKYVSHRYKYTRTVRLLSYMHENFILKEIL